jgi:hypothetical protein
LPSGEPLVLDPVRERVLRVGDAGVVELMQARPDDEQLAVDDDGAAVLFSPLRSWATVRGADGATLGELPVARELRDVQSLSLGTSRRLFARTVHQETYALGSPGARLSTEAVLQTKREGAAFLPDGQGVSVLRSPQGNLELLVVGPERSSGRTAVSRRLQLATDAASGRILGTHGSTVCVRVERLAPSPALAVSREALCVDAATGKLALHAHLPSPGLYVPRAEMAMGASNPRLALLHPRPEGLAVIVYDLDLQGGAR